MGAEFDGISFSGLRIVVDVRPLGDDGVQLQQADTDALQAAIMEALPPVEAAITISVRRLVG